MEITAEFFQIAIESISEHQTESETTDKAPRLRYCCAVCNAFITDDYFSIHINGQHQFIKINPDQHEFSFVCFAEAQGCHKTGLATAKDSWFHNCQWRFAHCKSCSTQLGWFFSGAHNFFGLIREQLIDCKKVQD